MNCPKCGKIIDDNATVCPECGEIISPLGNAATPAETPAAQPVVVVDPASAPKNVKQFVKSLADKKMAKELNACSIICYVAAAVTLGLGLVGGSVASVILDAVVLLGLGIWLQVTYSRIPAILLLAYSIINVVYVAVTTKQLGGWLILVAGILAVVYTFKAKKEYDNYLKGGVQ